MEGGAEGQELEHRGPGAAPGCLTHLCVHVCTQGPQCPVHNVTANHTYVANNLCFPTDPPPAPCQVSEELLAFLHNPTGSHKQKHLVFQISQRFRAKFFLQQTFSHDNAFYSLSHKGPTPASRNKQQIAREEQIPELNIGCCSVLRKESFEWQNRLSFHNYYKCGCLCTYYTRQVNNITK